MDTNTNPLPKHMLSAGLATLLASSAQGIIVSVQTPGVSIHLPNGADYHWDINGDGTVDFVWTASSGVLESSINIKWGNAIGGNTSNALLGVFHGPVVLDNQKPINLNSNAYIGYNPTSSRFWVFKSNSTLKLLSDGEFSTTFNVVGLSSINLWGGATATGILGFRFYIPGSGTHYAWASITATGKDFSVDPFITINEWAYESTPGIPIPAGAVPEPETIGTGLGALALGAAGLRRWRKRRAACSRTTPSGRSDQ